MACIPDNEPERLKERVSVRRLVEATEIEMKKAGEDWPGRCLFRDRREASLAVSPGKNPWYCSGCQPGGGPID